MKNVIVSGFAAALLLAFPAFSTARNAAKRITPSKVIVTDKRTSAMNFTCIDVSSLVNLTVEERNDNIIIVRANENIMPYVRLSVQNGKLKADLDRFVSSGVTGGNLTVEILIPNNGKISRIMASGASSVDVKPLISARKFIAEVSGASHINADVKAESCGFEASGASTLDFSCEGGSMTLEASGAASVTGTAEVMKSGIDLSGAANVSLKGKSAGANMEASGAANFRGFDFHTDICTASVSGAANIEISCGETLSAHSSGIGKLVYKGDCNIASCSQSGMGVIKKK